MKEKPKRDNRSRPIFNGLSFFLLWIVLTVAMGRVSGTVFQWLRDGPNLIIGSESWVLLSLLNTFLFASLILPIEKLLIKLSFGQWIKGWIRASFLSYLIGNLQFFVLQALGLEMVITYDIPSLPYFLMIGFIAALPQAWVLRRYVQKPWLYIAAAMMSSVFPVLLLPYVADSIFASSMMLASSVFMIPIALLWLFRGTPTEEKVKRAENMTYERLEDTSPETEEVQEETFEEKYKRLRFRLRHLFFSWAR